MDNLANFSNSSKKAEASPAAETVEKDHDLLCSLYCFISCQYDETSHISAMVSVTFFCLPLCHTYGNNSYSGEKWTSGQNSMSTQGSVI